MCLMIVCQPHAFKGPCVMLKNHLSTRVWLAGKTGVVVGEHVVRHLILSHPGHLSLKAPHLGEEI